MGDPAGSHPLIRKFEFTLVLSGIQYDQFEEVGDLLYEATGGDASFCHQRDAYYLDFAREAAGLEGAIRSAVAQVRSAGFVVVRAEIDFHRN